MGPLLATPLPSVREGWKEEESVLKEELKDCSESETEQQGSAGERCTELSVVCSVVLLVLVRVIVIYLRCSTTCAPHMNTSAQEWRIICTMYILNKFEQISPFSQI